MGFVRQEDDTGYYVEQLLWLHEAMTGAGGRLEDLERDLRLVDELARAILRRHGGGGDGR